MADAPAKYELREGASLAAHEQALRLYKDMRRDIEEAPAGDNFAARMQEALDSLLKAYCLYGPRGVIGSFNGGKDAVVIVHLMRATLAHWCVAFQQDGPSSEDQPVLVWRPRFIYFRCPEEFPEISRFIGTSAAELNLDLETYECGWLEGLKVATQAAFGDTHLPAGCRASLAFVLGTRSSDPNGAQEAFSPSSLDIHRTCRFMRVNPVLKWSYGDVWSFLRRYELPYCSLYDQGYTSLGTRGNTRPNPNLLRADGGYDPAYQLEGWDQERAGRGRAPEPAAARAKEDAALKEPGRATGPPPPA